MTQRLAAKRLCVWALVLACAFPGCARLGLRGTGSLSHAPDQAHGNGKKVVILVIDGLRYTESFGDPSAAHIPHLAGELRSRGTFFDDFRNEGVTKTNPGHASILTGTWQQIANDGTERPDKPTIFEYFRKYYSAPADGAWMIAGKTKLAVCSYGSDPDYGADYGATENMGVRGDATVVDTLLAVLHARHPALVLANLPSVDDAGDNHDWEGYLSAIETVDSLVSVVWSVIQKDKFYRGSTYLFVTNDHGRHDDVHGGFGGHGCSCEGCRHIMLLAMGPDVMPDHTVTQPYSLRDLCSTVGEILRCPVPGSEGTVIAEMFIGGLTWVPTGSR